jgi:hypothetical protein
MFMLLDCWGGCQDLAWGATAHEVAVIVAAGVVRDEPAVEFGAELGESIEASAVECAASTLAARCLGTVRTLRCSSGIGVVFDDGGTTTDSATPVPVVGSPFRARRRPHGRRES